MESAISQLLRRDTRRLGTSSLLVLEDLCFQLKIRSCACRNTRGRGFRGLFSLTLVFKQNRSDSNQLYVRSWFLHSYDTTCDLCWRIYRVFQKQWILL